MNNFVLKWCTAYCNFNFNFIFDKGGGIPEANRASELSELLGLNVSASQVCFKSFALSSY